MSATDTISDPTALDHARRLLLHHSKRGHGFIQTLNRLLGEQIERKPGLVETDLVARYEWWTLDQLAVLWRKHGRQTPRRNDEPVLVVHFDGAMRLVDGTNRINDWEAKGESGPHQVILLSVENSGAKDG